jgi:hypothetical protein
MKTKSSRTLSSGTYPNPASIKAGNATDLLIMHLILRFSLAVLFSLRSI